MPGKRRNRLGSKARALLRDQGLIVQKMENGGYAVFDPRTGQYGALRDYIPSWRTVGRGLVSGGKLIGRGARATVRTAMKYPKTTALLIGGALWLIPAAHKMATWSPSQTTAEDVKNVVQAGLERVGVSPETAAHIGNTTATAGRQGYKVMPYEGQATVGNLSIAGSGLSEMGRIQSGYQDNMRQVGSGLYQMATGSPIMGTKDVVSGFVRAAPTSGRTLGAAAKTLTLIAQKNYLSDPMNRIGMSPEQLFRADQWLIAQGFDKGTNFKPIYDIPGAISRMWNPHSAGVVVKNIRR